jgi:hypothetical protein
MLGETTWEQRLVLHEADRLEDWEEASNLEQPAGPQRLVSLTGENGFDEKMAEVPPLDSVATGSQASNSEGTGSEGTGLYFGHYDDGFRNGGRVQVTGARSEPVFL